MSYRDDWDLRSRARAWLICVCMRVRAWLICVCMRVIGWLEPHRNETLSWHLHQMADRYSKRPEGRWETP